MTDIKSIKIGTRGSPLALKQADMVKQALEATYPDLAPCEIVPIKTSGDRFQSHALSEIGGKGLFTKEIEQQLLDGTIHLAVHSMKDMPTALPDGLEISCMLPREDVRDAFISNKAASLDELPAGSMVGTASLRRQAIVLNRRPDLKVCLFRGSVQTRLQKLQDGQADATFLAMAGLIRSDNTAAITQTMAPDIMLPAVGQGAIGIEIRSDAPQIRDMLDQINCPATFDCVEVERAFLRALDGSCRTPIAALAEIDGPNINFRGLILSPDGAQKWGCDFTCSRDTAAARAFDEGIKLKDQGACVSS